MNALNRADLTSFKYPGRPDGTVFHLSRNNGAVEKCSNFTSKNGHSSGNTPEDTISNQISAFEKTTLDAVNGKPDATSVFRPNSESSRLSFRQPHDLQ